MAVPTLTNPDGVVFTFNEGDADEVETALNAGLDFDAMPTMPATAGLLFDFNGVTKTIRISGALTLATSSRTSVGSCISIDEQRQWLEAFVDGQQRGSTFTSNYSSTWNGHAWVSSKILVGAITFTEQSGYPNHLKFTMQFSIGDV